MKLTSSQVFSSFISDKYINSLNRLTYISARGFEDMGIWGIWKMGKAHVVYYGKYEKIAE